MSLERPSQNNNLPITAIRTRNIFIWIQIFGTWMIFQRISISFRSWVKKFHLLGKMKDWRLHRDDFFQICKAMLFVLRELDFLNMLSNRGEVYREKSKILRISVFCNLLFCIQLLFFSFSKCGFNLEFYIKS